MPPLECLVGISNGSTTHRSTNQAKHLGRRRPCSNALGRPAVASAWNLTTSHYCPACPSHHGASDWGYGTWFLTQSSWCRSRCPRAPLPCGSQTLPSKNVNVLMSLLCLKHPKVSPYLLGPNLNPARPYTDPGGQTRPSLPP